jgi:hypothetical protein
MPDQATLIVVIKGLQGLFDWSVCLQDGFAPGPRVLPIPRVRDHRMERIGLQGPTVVLGHGHGRCGWHHTAAPVVVAPRPIDAIQTTLSNDDRG